MVAVTRHENADTFAAAFEAEVAKSASDMDKIAVGDVVEALHAPNSCFEDRDTLYYKATVVGLTPGGTFKLSYEDGVEEGGVPRDWIKPHERRHVWENEEVVVVDGHMEFDGGPERVRLMAFKSSPQLYQSGVLLGPPKGDKGELAGIKEDAEDSLTPYNFLDMAFEQHACCLFGLSFLQGAARPGGPEGGARVAVVGVGGGLVCMAIRQLWPGCVIDAVELSGGVVEAAHKHFGLEEPSDRMRMHVEDGAAFLGRAEPGTYDLIVLDVAAHDASTDEESEDVEFPPAPFTSPAFLSGSLAAALKPGGLCCVNVMGERKSITSWTEKFSNAFASTYVLAIDPNYFFYGFAEPTSMLPHSVEKAVDSCPGLSRMVKEPMGLVKRTYALAADNMCLGWLPLEQFQEMLRNEECII